MNEAKKFNANEEAEQFQQLQAVKVEVERLKKAKEEKMIQNEQQKRKLEECSRQMDYYQVYCKAKEDHKNAMIVHSEKQKELLARQIEVQRILQEQQQMEQASLIQKQQAGEAVSLAEAKKKENSHAENTIIIPGKAEVAKLAEHKMKLAGQIGDTSKNLEQEQAWEREALAVKTDAKKDAKEKAEKLGIEYQAKQEESQTANQKHKEFQKSHEEQISSHESLKQKFSEMYVTEKRVYDTKYKMRHDQLSKELEQHSEDLEWSHESEKIKIEIFETGIEKLEDAIMAEIDAQAE